jgi:hypothetical protein
MKLISLLTNQRCIAMLFSDGPQSRHRFRLYNSSNRSQPGGGVGIELVGGAVVGGSGSVFGSGRVATTTLMMTAKTTIAKATVISQHGLEG